MKSGVQLLICHYPINHFTTRLNAMKSGVQQNLTELVEVLNGIEFECNEKRSATDKWERRLRGVTLFECNEKRSATLSGPAFVYPLREFECNEKRSATERDD